MSAVELISGVAYGGKENEQWTETDRRAAVRQSREQTRRECDGAQEEGHAQERERRQGRQSNEPQTSHRDRTFGGPEERRQGSSQEGSAKAVLTVNWGR